MEGVSQISMDSDDRLVGAGIMLQPVIINSLAVCAKVCALAVDAGNCDNQASHGDKLERTCGKRW